MAKVNADKYGTRSDKLTVDDLEGDAAVLTVDSFGEKTFTDIAGTTRTQKVTPFLTFRETGDKVLWLNSTQVGYLIERLGDDTDDWMGKPIPVERHEYKSFNGEEGVNLWVSPPERWDDLLAQAGFGKSRKSAAKVPAPKSAAKGKKR